MTKHNYRCKFCKEMFNTKAEAKLHIYKIHKMDVEKRYRAVEEGQQVQVIDNVRVIGK